MTLILLIAGVVLVLVLAAVLLVLVIVLMLSRRRPEAPSAASFLSPDGNWRWDGVQWQPAGRSPTPPASPAP